MGTGRGTAAILAAAGLLTSTSALAQEAVATQQAENAAQSGQIGETIWLDRITITSDLVPVKLYDSPASVSVIDEESIDRLNVSSPRELIRDEPGVSIGNQASRGGMTNYVIRGIGGNRVRIEVDGLRMPDFPGTNMGAGTYTRDFIDLDSVKQVEIVRGPASALHGSDALGGVVSYVTKDPADYLDLVGKDWYVGLKAGFDSADMSMTETVTTAARAGRWEAMLLYTRRDGHEIEPNTSRTPNPQNFGGNNFLGKVVYNSDGWGKWTLTGEHMRKNLWTNLFTDLTDSGPSRVLSSEGDDTTVRDRVSLEWDTPISGLLANNMRVKAFWTEVDREELTTQLRAVGAGTIGPNVRRDSDFGFVQSIYGGEIQFDAEREWLGGTHLITYGAEFSQTSTSRPRYRIETDLGTGDTTNIIGGATFPNKNFPDTDTTQAAFYIQDIAEWGRLRVIPAVRFDWYHLSPDPDWMFDNSAGDDFQVAEQTHFSVSPKLGVTYDLNDTYRLFGQYAHGFRPPPYDNANFGFSNPAHGYEILPSPDLKPEESDGFEAGLRGRFANGSSFQVSGFYNMYRDFIDTEVVGFSPGGLIQFQYQNLSNVTIWGFEAKGEWRFRPNWSLFGTLAYAHGENEETGDPIDSIDPLTITGGLRYDDPDGWSAELRARHAFTQDRVSDPSMFETPSWTTVDAIASYDVSPNMTINAGVFNIFDEAYFHHQDVAGMPETSPNLELLRGTGRTIAVNITTRW